MAATVDVSVSHFAKFAGGTPSARIKAVADAKQGYEPAHDYYKGLRDAIQRGHEEGDLNAHLKQAIEESHPKRTDNYVACAQGYRRFVRKAGFTWIAKPRSRHWVGDRLRVRVSPEIYAESNGDDMVLRLVWSEASLSALGRRVMLHLVNDLYARDGWTGGLVDMREGELFRPGQAVPSADAYLASEVAAFLALWDR